MPRAEDDGGVAGVPVTLPSPPSLPLKPPLPREGGDGGVGGMLAPPLSAPPLSATPLSAPPLSAPPLPTPPRPPPPPPLPWGGCCGGVGGALAPPPSVMPSAPPPMLLPPLPREGGDGGVGGMPAPPLSALLLPTTECCGAAAGLATRMPQAPPRAPEPKEGSSGTAPSGTSAKGMRVRSSSAAYSTGSRAVPRGIGAQPCTARESSASCRGSDDRATSGADDLPSIPANAPPSPK